MKRINQFENFLKKFQNNVCEMLEDEDIEFTFTPDIWKYKSGGGGETRTLEGGNLVERGGVNFSHVEGPKLPPAATAKRPELAGSHFHALGVSLVIHPRNPYIPTTHANLRMFQTENKNGETVWWFGGGFDLTPYYPFEKDCVLWHEHAKAACDILNPTAYQEYKKWCDKYFYLPHRDETRGIGGLFFDDLNTPDFDTCFEFMKACGKHFVEAYKTIVQRRKDIPFGEREKEFQEYRRGRYVEFNLLYDRGTHFGLQSKGRTESILVSMPPRASWKYSWEPEEGTPEAKLYERYLRPQDWV